MAAILVVDDDQDLLAMVKLLLEMRGHKVETQDSGHHVIEKVLSFKPALILLDINLGDTDGRKICNDIKTNHGTACLPVILYSANHYPPGMLLLSRADAFIKKPFAVTQLLDTVKTLLQASH